MSTPVRNAALIFNEIPTGYPEPGKTTVYRDSATISLETVPLEGGILVKMLVFSVDPFQRGRMREHKAHTVPPAYTLGEPVYGFGIGRVLRSESSKFKEGDHVDSYLAYQEYNVVPASKLESVFKVTELKDKNGTRIPWSVYLGVLGMPGRTAYGGWKEYAEAKKGETVFVSAAAGAVGSFVVQLAKRDGLKVIATAGSDEKLAFCRSLGADVVFNYKTENMAEILKAEGPIDIYWDNVAGETLDLALANANLHARFLECGFVSSNNKQDGVHLKNFYSISRCRIRMRGLLVFDTDPKYREPFYEEIPPLVASGEIKYTEDVTKGLEFAGHAILEVQQGRNKAKKVVWVADD